MPESDDDQTIDQQLADAPDNSGLTGGMVAAPGEQEAVARGEKQPHEVEMISVEELAELTDEEDPDEPEPLEEDD